ncbi:MAG: hydroxypyruvate isomerase [Flavobacteriaceae bacterium]|nr:hydroxypyruvate isomerase [Flavobacteriaceae bacterium]
MNRRNLLKTFGTGVAGISISPLINAQNGMNKKSKKLKGNINHSVSAWCYSKLPFEELVIQSKKIGLVGIDLVGSENWDILKKHGMISTMCYGDLEGKSTRSLTNGWCDKSFHDELISNYSRHIKLVSNAGWKNLICFSGSRRGISDDQGLINCIEGLSKILPIAEKHNVVIQMELLNSKVDHQDYMCDNSKWGVELCKRLNSNNFKLLYDIYHMQIMEGDVIRTIQENYKYIGHYHTAGVPGRNEIDQTQELYYPAIMKAIVSTGYNGVVAQEFIPTKDDLINGLAEAIQICDI